MASVQELLLAAQAKQPHSPISDLARLIDAGVGGYSEGKAQKSQQDLQWMQTAAALLKMQQTQQEMEQGKQTQQIIQQLLGIKSEQGLRDGLAAAGAPPIPTTPMDKFDREIAMDAKGKLSLKLTPKKDTAKAPTGFRFTADGSLEPIPGGPADIKTQTEKAKADLALAGQSEQAKNVMDTIDEALPLVNKWSTGYGSTLKNIPLTAANALQAKIKTITSNLGINQLQEMKAASKTGASGFGQLSDRELEVITSAVTNLNQAQSPEDIKKNLNKIKTHYSNWLELQKGNDPYRGTPPPAGGAPQLPIAGGNAQPTMRWNPATKKLEKL